MIKLKLSVNGQRDAELPISEGEILTEAAKRALEPVKLDGKKPEEVFQILVNGHKIPSDLWAMTKLRKNDTVLIAPVLRGDDPSAAFRQIFVVAVTVVASVFLTPAGGATIASSLMVAGVSIAANLLIHSLIPPSVPGGLKGPGDITSSQMYSVNGQSNQVRKFGKVPKVYGRHRIYPFVAANPYTELETNPDTGTLDNYFYAIYDLGFGPMTVDQIKIGETPITSFDDAIVNIVDTQKPAVDEGEWDEATRSTFEFYKGDVSAEQIGVVLDGNKNVGTDPQETWEAERNTPINEDGVDQQITLTFLNPQGLYGFASNGSQGPRSINLEIYFALVGTDDWRPFNDLTYVSEFLGVGGDQAYQDFPLEALPTTYSGGAPYTQISQSVPYNPQVANWPVFATRPDSVVYRKFGYPKGATQFVVKDNAELIVGADFRHQGKTLGKILSVTNYVPNSDYCTVTIDTPTTQAITVFGFEGNGTDWIKLEDGSLKDFSVLNRLLGKAKITRQDTGPVYSTFRFTPRTSGQYKVRVTRISTAGTYSAQVADSLTWAQMSTRFDRAPIVTDKRHFFLEVKIRATNQLNGAISNLSAVATSVVDVYDPDTQTWAKAPSNNPAWIFCDLLTSEVNKRAIGKHRLHLDSIVEWAEYCEETPTPPSGYDYIYQRFECNFVLDYPSTLQGVLNQVANAAQASLNIVDGKYGVLLDKKREVPTQIFTPRNSKDFSSSRNFSARPHALKVKYIDPSVNWQVAETTVYDNGYSFANATEFDEITCFAVTNQEQAWRYGRYMLAQNRLRQENISLTVDFEHLVCSRGDFVQITQDVMKVGGYPARVRSRVGNRIVIDDGLELAFGPTYGFIARSVADGIFNNTLTVVSADTFDLDGSDFPDPGDLVIIGETDKVAYDCIIKSISPNADGTANISLVEKADEIYDAESTDTFPEYDPQLSNTTDPDIAPPGEVEDLEIQEVGYECSGSGYLYFIDLDWDVPQGSAFEFFQVFVNSGRGYTEAGTTRESSFRYEVDQTRLGLLHQFKVLAVSATGKKLDLGAVGYVSDTPLSKSTPPSDVQSLSIDITGETIQLTWPAVSDCDVSEYLIRYTPLTSGATWEASIPLNRVSRETTLSSGQARTGTYLIKAVDFNGNESVIAAKALTTVPSLFNLNVIEEITDFPALTGVFDRVVKDGDTLVLQKLVDGLPTDVVYSPDGYYYYSELLDLGDIFTVRLAAMIQAEGLTSDDLMVNWTTLDAVPFLANSRHSEWDVEAEYRATNVLNVMADWDSLSDIEVIGGGDPDNFTEWRKFTIGDATGRIFQFRLKLISNKDSVTPRVFDGTIRADMPDRREEYRNLVATGGTKEVVYSTAFKGPGTTPVITVSVDDLESGDYWTFSSKTLEGFTINFFDKDDNPVEKTFDVAVAGYGRQAPSVI